MLKILIMNIIEKINKEFANKSYYEKQFSEFAAKCYDLHKNVNQTYDDNPYSLHLKMVTNMLPIVFEDAWKANFLDSTESSQLLVDYITCFYASLLHDSIEDARLTYNDVNNIVSEYNSFVISVLGSKLYHGTLADLYPEISTTDHWHENVLEAMKADKIHFGMEENEPYCKNKVPREGVVIRIDNDKKAEAFKLKCLKFYEFEKKRVDKGEVDIEMAQAYSEEN